ncbi:MAG: phenylalanine--tRNA ligase subunit beta [bacterium]|nr:phenylalanine--tRNA ligase subunit beta [bacterium]
MKISLAWLGDYIEFTEEDPQKISDAITAHVAEVDEVEVQGALLEHCCVGKVITLEKHPNADTLQLCEVLTDKGSKHVVCGGTNLRKGMRIAFAHIGARVKWHGEELMTLEPVKIRGEHSEGMICAAEELGIESLFPECTGHDIVDMGNGDDNVGKPLREVLSLNDTILHIDNHAITHRADLFSHIGFAFECTAIGIAKWKKMPEFKPPEFPTDKLPFNFRVTAEGLIPRYCSCLLSIDAIGETPDWMRSRLASVGIRSISLPIDITNFVMMEMGVPMHSFDADDIKGDCIARISKKDEPLQTLDGKEWKLPEGALVFSDDEGNFDLVGIMGGMRSSTKESTRKIYLHALSLDPVRIRNTVIATGHRTDAATIYEKKVPHVATELGFYRALELFLELVPGAKIISAPESFGDNGEPKPIKFSATKAQSVLGADIPEDTMQKIFEDLGFTVEGTGENMLVTPPLHRLGDISGAHDLIEEVGRIYGYNNIENVLPHASISPPDRDQRLHHIRDRLVDQKFIELLPLSLVGPDLLKKSHIAADNCAKIENPIGHETSLMVPSTLPALFEQAGKNMLEVQEMLRTFHVSTVFAGTGDSHKELGALIATRSSADLLSDPFLLLKQEVFSALEVAGYSVSIDVSNDVPAFAQEGRCAHIIADGQTIGTLFEVHADVCKNFDLPARAAGLTINITTLFAAAPAEVLYGTIPEFPAVRYDTTVSMSHSKSARNLLKQIRESSKLLESAEVADLYGKDGKDYKLTFRCTYRSPDKTLTEQEAKQEFAKVEKILL